MSLHSVRLCLNSRIWQCVFFLGVVHICMHTETWLSFFAAQNFAATLYLLFILHAFATHFVYYFTMCQVSSHISAVTHYCHLCCMATLMMLGHCQAALSLACCFASVKLFCPCQTALSLPCCFGSIFLLATGHLEHCVISI